MADLKSELFQALGYTGGIHLVTEYLLTQWQKNNGLTPSDADSVPTSSTAPHPTGGTAPGQVLWTLYSIDSSPATEAALTFAAALLPALSGGGGAAGGSAPALPAGSNGYAAPLLAASVGYLVGKA